MDDTPPDPHGVPVPRPRPPHEARPGSAEYHAEVTLAGEAVAREHVSALLRRLSRESKRFVVVNQRADDRQVVVSLGVVATSHEAAVASAVSDVEAATADLPLVVSDARAVPRAAHDASFGWA